MCPNPQNKFPSLLQQHIFSSLMMCLLARGWDNHSNNPINFRWTKLSPSLQVLIREAISLGYTLSEEKTNRNFCFMPTLKSPYHGFLKMTVHVVWNIALKGMKTSCKDLYLKVHRI